MLSQTLKVVFVFSDQNKKSINIRKSSKQLEKLTVASKYIGLERHLM